MEADIGEDLAEVGWSAEVDSRGFLLGKWWVGSEERMWKPSLMMRFSLGRPGVKVMGGLGDLLA